MPLINAFHFVCELSCRYLKIVNTLITKQVDMADEKLKNEIEDQELNDLLDVALKDFNEEHKPDKEDSHETESTTDKNTTASLGDAWTTDFVGQLVQQLGDNDIGASYREMMQTAGLITDEDNIDKFSMNADFQSAAAGALHDLTAASESLPDVAELAEMFGRASLLEYGPSAVLPFLDGILEQLLSKETLFPSLKELVGKFPKWLEENKATLSSDDVQRLTKQFELLQQVCGELEKEKDDDTAEIKQRRFERLSSLMREVQGCGQLPEELLYEQATPFQAGAEGNPLFAAFLRGVDASPNCCLM